MKVAMPQRAPRLRDQVYQTLRAMLRDGSYPETRLVEEELAIQLNVSRTPVREALFQLCREGVLEDTGRGYRRPELSAQDVQEIADLRRLLEPAMARAVVARTTPATLAEFAAVIAREAAAVEADPAGFIAANAAFRVLFLESCGNRRLAQMMQIFDDQIARLRQATLGPLENRRVTLAAHRRFLAGLEAADAEAAAGAILDLLAAATRYYASVWAARG
jgi:DNA-binding GntR family transcriptional regulator